MEYNQFVKEVQEKAGCQDKQPADPDKVQRDLQIEQEGSYIITVKNPEAGSPGGAGLQGRQKADFPKRLQEVFGDRKFADFDPADFLDHEGAELILIAAKEDPKKELGVQLESEKTADIFADLKLKREEHPLGPLFEGKWE